MKKTLLSCMAMFACAGLMVNAEVNEPVLSLSFDQNGLVVGGTDAASATHATRTEGTTTMTFQNTMDGKWLGATDQNGVFAVKYDADDQVGQALQGSFTVEFLANVVYNQGYGYTAKGEKTNGSQGGTMKIFSTEQSGGWSFMRTTADGMMVEIGFDKDPDDGVITNTYYKVKGVQSDPETGKDTRFFNLTGRYYQHVFTYNAATNELRLYGNGQLIAKKTIDPAVFVFPNVGNVKREKGMDLFMGGDIGSKSTYIENGNRTVFVHGKIYSGAMTDEEVAALYNTPEIKAYTEMETIGHTAMFVDAVFGKDGAVKNNTAFSQPLETAGTMLTQWNAEQMRYETVQDTANNKNFYYCDVYKDTRIVDMLANALSFEVYMKAGTATPAATMSPISIQQGGGYGFEFQKTGLVKFNFNTYGWRTTVDAAGNDGPHCSTREGTLTTDYDHYVVVANRPDIYSRIYKNGELVAENISENESRFLGQYLPYAGYQWIAIGGDAKANVDHSACDFPFQGNISIARAWGKSLTEEDVKALYAQATSTSSVVTFNEYGLATVCLPFAAKLPEGVDAYIGYKDYGNAIYTMKVAKGGDVLPYGLPVLLAYGKTGDVTISAADLTVESALETADYPNQLEGSFVTTQMAAGDAYVLSGNAFVKCEAGTLPAKAVWFNADANDVDSKALENVVRPDPVGVKAVESAQKLEKDVYYDLEGRKVSNPGRGIYIKNGVKVFNAR